MQETPKLGQLILGKAFRDAIHVAVAPVVAGEELSPGQQVFLIGEEAFYALGKNSGSIGIVDPFLARIVSKGERFWLCLYPGTTTSLRHAWTHPAFEPKVP